MIRLTHSYRSMPSCDFTQLWLSCALEAGE